MKNTPLFLNGELELDEAESLVASGQIDAPAFGRLWISHPDLAKRIEYGKALDNQLDYLTFYGAGPEETQDDLRRGYTDYPAAVY